MSRKLTPEERLVRKEEKRLYKRQWYLANRERTLAVNQAYREKNPDLIKRLKKEWAANNPSNVAASRQRAKEDGRLAASRKRSDAKCKDRIVAYFKKYYQANRETIMERSRRWEADNYEYAQELKRTRGKARVVDQWLKKSGWSEAEYWRRVALGCEICGSTERRLCFDHDHDTGVVRGLLCDYCNLRLDWAIEFYEEIGCYHLHSVRAVA